MSGTIPSEAPNHNSGCTIKNLKGTATLSNGGVTNTDISYTVSTGKTFYITDVVMTLASSTATFQITYGAGPTVVFQGGLSSSWPFQATGLTTRPTAPAASVMKILFSASAAGSPVATYQILGYEA